MLCAPEEVYRIDDMTPPGFCQMQSTQMPDLQWGLLREASLGNSSRRQRREQFSWPQPGPTLLIHPPTHVTLCLGLLPHLSQGDLAPLQLNSMSGSGSTCFSPSRILVKAMLLLDTCCPPRQLRPRVEHTGSPAFPLLATSGSARLPDRSRCARSCRASSRCARLLGGSRNSSSLGGSCSCAMAAAPTKAYPGSARAEMA